MFHCFTNHRNLLSPLPKRHSLRSRDLRIREDPHGAIRCTRPIVKPCSFGMQRFGTVGKPEKPSAICDVCWDGWRERVEIHLCYGVNGGDTINTVGGFLDWGVGRRNLTFRLLRGGWGTFLINLGFTHEWSWQDVVLTCESGAFWCFFPLCFSQAM